MAFAIARATSAWRAATAAGSSGSPAPPAAGDVCGEMKMIVTAGSV
jgi:hypothetical protein